MQDINELLAQHFSGEDLGEYKHIIDQFRGANPDEYAALKKLWTTDGVKVSSYDIEDAWQSVVNTANRLTLKPTPKTKIVSLYSKLAKVASIAAIFLLVAYFVFPQITKQDNNLLVELVGDDSKEGVILDDGSIIYLNKDAKLSYPKSFDGEQRVVSLDGEAYFDIARDEERPFKIKTNHSEVEVLGTSFNIDTDKLRTEVAVTSGKVKVSSLTTDENVILIKNQAATVDNKTLNTYTVKNENFVAWKTGVFTFREENIATIVAELNTFYKDDISLKTHASECVLSASFDKASVQQVLEIVTLSCNLNLTETNGIYELK